MKIKTSYKITLIFPIGLAILLIFGIKNPLQKLTTNKLSTIEKVRVNKGEIHILTVK